MTTQYRAWLFTWNNPPADARPQDWEAVYGIYQKEKGAEGTEHLQGYIILPVKKTLAYVRSHMCNVAHWEPRRGTHEQAREYCSKSETRIGDTVEWGVPPRQGKRNDLAMVQAALDEGATEVEISETFFSSWCRYHKAFREYRMLKSKGRNSEEGVTTIVLHGPPGTGKTRMASLIAPDAYWLTAPNSSTSPLWWDGYQGHEAVIIDEFYGWIQHPFMLRLCDRYPLNVQVKGGTVPFMAKTIIITSNKHPYEWWPRTTLGAMTRRISAPNGTVHELKEEPNNYELTKELIMDPEQFKSEATLLAELDGFKQAEAAEASKNSGANGFIAFARG